MNRRDYEDETRRELDTGGGAFTAAVFIKYLALIIIVLIIAYVVLRVLGVIQGIFG